MMDLLERYESIRRRWDGINHKFPKPPEMNIDDVRSYGIDFFNRCASEICSDPEYRTRALDDYHCNGVTFFSGSRCGVYTSFGGEMHWGEFVNGISLVENHSELVAALHIDGKEVFVVSCELINDQFEITTVTLYGDSSSECFIFNETDYEHLVHIYYEDRVVDCEEFVCPMTKKERFLFELRHGPVEWLTIAD